MDIPALPIWKVVLKAQKPIKKDYPDELKTIGDHIRRKRIELKLFQKELAKFIGVDECTVTNWEKNHSKPRLPFLPKIIRFLGYIPFEINDSNHREQIKLLRKIKESPQKNYAKEIGVDPFTLSK